MKGILILELVVAVPAMIVFWVITGYPRKVLRKPDSWKILAACGIKQYRNNKND